MSYYRSNMAIKQEEEDEYEYANSFWHHNTYVSRQSTTPRATKNNYMACYEDKIDTSGCFHSTIIIEGPEHCLKISQCLWDTGADATHIREDAVEEAGVRTYKTEPQTFYMANGDTTVHDTKAIIKLWISGICHTIHAWVDRGNSHHIMLLGRNTYDKFLGGQKTIVTPYRHCRVTVAEDITGLRPYRFVVQRDRPGGQATSEWMSKTRGVQWSKSKQVMACELKGKGPRQRLEEKHRQRERDSECWGYDN